VSGTIVPPGGLFDLTATLSPITLADGYHMAGILSNGIHTEGVGGGLSQMATTSYNAAYFAGFDILQHRPHSVYFTRYPAGRESTIFVGSINMVFRNDTPYAALMNSYVEGGRLHVDIWSTPHYRVESSNSGRSNVQAAGSRVVTHPDCEPSAKGQPGFTITNYRKVYLGQDLVKNEAETWTYKPDHAIVCG
jgi:vancomycin resistance protein YoaR